MDGIRVIVISFLHGFAETSLYYTFAAQFWPSSVLNGVVIAVVCFLQAFILSSLTVKFKRNKTLRLVYDYAIGFE